MGEESDHSKAKKITLSPQQFAEMFVDENLTR
jgi:hypothetical protein